MIGVGVALGRLAAAGVVLGVGEGAAGLVLAVTFATGVDVPGVAAVAAAGASKLIAPLFQIWPRLDASISTSIGMRRGLAGCDGRVICLPLMNS
jgi:hypothetical protein